MTVRNTTVVAIDFDGTLAEHRYPDIGAEISGAFYWLKEFQVYGAKLMLWTMRSGETLGEAIAWAKERGIEFWAHNENPDQRHWTSSNKQHASIYVDDAAFGCPLLPDGSVDWSIVGPGVVVKLELMGLRRLTDEEGKAPAKKGRGSRGSG